MILRPFISIFSEIRVLCYQQKLRNYLIWDCRLEWYMNFILGHREGCKSWQIVREGRRNKKVRGEVCMYIVCVCDSLYWFQYDKITKETYPLGIVAMNYLNWVHWSENNLPKWGWHCTFGWDPSVPSVFHSTCGYYHKSPKNQEEYCKNTLRGKATITKIDK